MKSYYIYNGVIVNEQERFRGSLFITEGRIEKIFRGNAPAGFSFPGDVVAIDARERYLLPGVIDDHVHFREPGLEAKADIATESRAAVAGGVTSFMEMPNTVPNATTLEILEDKYQRAAARSLANYSFYLGASSNNIEEIRRADPSKICGLKLFLGSSTGNMKVDDLETLDQIFCDSPLMIVVHAENDNIIARNLAAAIEKYGDGIPAGEHPVIRSEEACISSTSLAVEMAIRHNRRTHLAHLSTSGETLFLRNDLPVEAKLVTGEVCVHHLWFDERDYDDLGGRIKWNPAIKSSEHRNALLRAVLDNRIDVIATDHAPHLLSEKENSYRTCPSGGPLVQHGLTAMFTLFQLGQLPVETIVEKMCHGPARLFRIENRGFIREGYAADLTIVDPDDPWTVEKENILYKCGWSPFEGVTFRSRVTHTWVNGHLVFAEGKFDESVKGERLRFNALKH